MTRKHHMTILHIWTNMDPALHCELTQQGNNLISTEIRCILHQPGFYHTFEYVKGIGCIVALDFW